MHNGAMQSNSICRGFFCTLLTTVLILSACGTELTSKIDPPLPSPNAKAAAVMLVGSYDNAQQAAADANCPSLVLHICPIWTDRIDGLWVYVEQATADKPETPYRQRVYQIVDGNEALAVDCRLYELPDNPLQFAGAWKEHAALNQVSPYLLLPRAGCTITLNRSADGDWVGATQPQQCLTDYKGAAYTTSAVTLTSKELRSWDRGFDDKGTQVWGSTTGPTIFVKKSN